jgi:hypothetical protein
MRTDLFPPNSRYHGVETKELNVDEGITIVYLQRRLIPSPDRFAPLFEHKVKTGERLDNITAQYFGDPEQFWRLCDANNAMDPEELTDATGRRITITLPEGIPGQPNA